MTDPLSIERIVLSFAQDWRLNEAVLAVPGFATPKLRRLLNAICDFDGCNYLEVGTLHGASLIAAAWNNKGNFCGIDNFSQFGGDLKTLQDNLRKFENEYKVRTIVSSGTVAVDYSVQHGPQDVNVLFYDAHHSEEATRDTMIRLSPILADRFILIVDDWSWIGPRRGTEAAIAANGWRVLLKIEVNDNYNSCGWGVGVCVILAEKGNA